MLRSPLQPMWDLTIHLPWRLASSLARRLVLSSATICNGPNPPLTDIVRFDPLRIVISLTIFKTCLLMKDFHTLLRNALFPSPIGVGSTLNIREEEEVSHWLTQD